MLVVKRFKIDRQGTAKRRCATCGKICRYPVAIFNPGFTLIEMLVTLSILAILVSLLLTGVQHAREVARKTQCLNHLRQIQLGVMNYESTFRCFPQLSNRSGSFLVTVLPYIERASIARQIEEFYASMPPSPPYPRFSIFVDVYLCPSDGSVLGDMASSNYCGNTGSWIAGNDKYNGIFNHLFEGIYPGGVVRARDVTDGLSNTNCLSEWLRSDSSWDRMRINWNTPESSRDRSVFSEICRSAPASPRENGWVGNQNKGRTWDKGSIMITGFNHVCIPNSPSCFNGGHVATGAASPSSLHTGVVNVTLADGHVKTVSDMIDADVWFQLGSRDGND